MLKKIENSSPNTPADGNTTSSVISHDLGEDKGSELLRQLDNVKPVLTNAERVSRRCHNAVHHQSPKKIKLVFSMHRQKGLICSTIHFFRFYCNYCSAILLITQPDTVSTT